MSKFNCPLPFSDPTSCYELDKAYQQGRSDGIDELVKALKRSDDIYTSYSSIEVINQIADTVKEQRHE